MSVNGKKTGIETEDILCSGKIAGLAEKECRKIIAEVRDAVAEWERFASEAEVKDEFVTKIGNVLRM